MRNRSLLTLSIVILSAGHAFADSEDVFDNSPEREVRLKITAASAFLESELDSSSTVSVVTRKDWESRGARVLPEAVSHLPGVMLLSPPAGGQLIQVRSYDSTSLRGRATIIDGVPINTFAFGSEVYSNAELQLPILDRLELVRGPSSVIYGSDAMHSAVILSTYSNRADHLEIAGGISSENLQNLAIRGTTIFSDSNSLHVAGSFSEQGDVNEKYSYHSGTGYATAERDMSYRAGSGVVHFEHVDSNLSYNFEYLFDISKAKEYPGSGTALTDPLDRDLSDRDGNLQLIKAGITNALQQQWEVSWNNYYWLNHYGQNYWLNAPIIGFSFEDQSFVEDRKGSKVTLTNPELTWGDTLTQLSVSVGYEQQRITDNDVTSQLYRVFPIPTPDYSGLSRNIASASIEGKTAFASRTVQIIYGDRIDRYSSFGTEHSPRIGLVWMPTNEYSIKGVYGKAFRAPSANELLGTNYALGDPNLKPETIDNFELTLSKVNRHSATQLVAFDTIWDRRIIFITNAQHLSQYAGVGKSEARGIELSHKMYLDNWRLELNGSRIINKTLETSPRACSCDPDMFPSWILNLGIGYHWAKPSIDIFWNNSMHNNVRTGDDTLRNSTANVEDAGFFYRSDLTISHDWNTRWNTSLVFLNIFDKKNTWPTLLNSRDGVRDTPFQIGINFNYTPTGR